MDMNIGYAIRDKLYKDKGMFISYTGIFWGYSGHSPWQQVSDFYNPFPQQNVTLLLLPPTPSLQVG